jgi:hypothetical protein
MATVCVLSGAALGLSSTLYANAIRKTYLMRGTGNNASALCIFNYLMPSTSPLAASCGHHRGRYFRLWLPQARSGTFLRGCYRPPPPTNAGNF